MQVVNPQIILNKKVLLRYDIDVALGKGTGGRVQVQVTEDFKLRAGLETLKLCLENASKTIIIGHVGRPFATAEDERKGNHAELSAKPIQEWFEQILGQQVDFAESLEQADQSTGKIVLLENIRFFHGEVPGAEYHASCTSKTCDVDFAKQLASLGEIYINEAFSSHNEAASTTMVPKFLPHAAGLHFAEEVRVLRGVRDNPKKPFIVIMGGAKVKDKLPVISALAQQADAVLVGGKLVSEIREQQVDLPKNVMVGKLNEDGLDISEDTTSAWSGLIRRSRMIVWNGPLGKIDNGQLKMENLGSAKGSYEIAKMVIESNGEIVVGGGDTIAFLNQAGLFEQFENKGFVSVGGGAMLKLLADGTLPTIEALN